MWAIECIFYAATPAAALTIKNTWTGKPGYLGGYVRTGVPDSACLADAAVGYWAVSAALPNSSTMPTWCKLVKLDQPSLNFVLGIV